MSTEPTLRERIRSGKTLLGCAATSMSPAAVEVIGYCGADFVWIEIEHGAIDLMQIEHLCRAAELRGMLSLLRVQDGSRPAVLRALEAGGKVIVTPMIHTPEQAAAVAEYGKYPPLGARGVQTGARGQGYGFTGSTPQEIFERANRETCLLVQIESAQAVENADAILAIPGIDGVLVGPGDLSASMGILGQWENEDLIRAIEGVFALANAHEKIAATVPPSNALSRRWKNGMAHMLNVSGDLGLIRKGLTERLAEVREL